MVGGFVFVHYFCNIQYYRTGSKCNEATKGRKWTQYHL